jgi:hypothetical protein
MNAHDILMYGNRTVLGTLDGIPARFRDEEGVCGWWSVKHIVAHLGSFELILADVLDHALAGGPTPNLDKQLELGGQGYNDYAIEARRRQSYAANLDEYLAAHARTLELVNQLPAGRLQQAGAIPWYGLEYSIDDFIVYQYYGHKREHMGQVGVFQDVLKARGDL